MAVFFEFPDVNPAIDRMPDIDARMSGQIMRHRRDAMPVEIGRRSHDGQPPVRAETDRDHIPVDRLSQTYARIETLPDDVDEPVINDDFNADIRKPGQKSGQLRTQHHFGGIVRTGDADRPGRSVPQLGEAVQFVTDLPDQRTDGPDQPLAGFGRGNIAGRSGQQPQSESFLKPPHGMAQGGRRNAEPERRLRKTPLFRHHHKGLQIVQVFHAD